ncbi:DEAD/DEAH box helicase family protein [Mesomycoplasma flocculare]|uniref:DEAD/DEAH box helicase family protein n=1 Tax=Mesomycoplasma flocculare TaxID=2128 RepID=UPI00136E81B9|nr:DEAD/DEAH box helicase family protein [Mesomycoplasma flocculare]MXR06004.1 hypothetical protein [Mesomycoplasma flocculare]
MYLIDAQEKVVNRLFKKASNSLKEEKKDAIYFKAPTGSGKTFMMINFIDYLITWSKSQVNLGLVFVITTLSSANLPGQIQESFLKYKNYINNKDLKIHRIESPSNTKTSAKIEKNYKFYAKVDNVYIIGSASFRKNSILRQEEAIESFLVEIKSKNYKLVYIRDEAHIGSDLKIRTNKDERFFEEKMQNSADFVLKMTATPDQRHNLIELSEKELNQDKIKLLKLKENHNLGLKPNLEYDNEMILNTACAEFKIIKEKYNDDQNEKGLIGINPAMLIQVDNSSQKDQEKAKEFEKNIKEIIKILEKNNLSWLRYFDQNDKETNLRHKKDYTLSDISKNSSAIDVIIFKIGPAIGWNIPRACMLVQLRNVTSNNLSIQTVGRIKRNPNPRYEYKENSEQNNFYIYSNLDHSKTTSKTILLKDKYLDEKFLEGRIESLKKNNDIFKLFNLEKYEKAFFAKINNHFCKNYENLTSWNNLNDEKISDYFNKKWNAEKENFREYIPANQVKYGNSWYSATKIYNIIQLEIYLNKIKQENKKYFSAKIKQYFEKIWEKLNQNAANQCSYQLFWYIIYKYLLTEIKEIYKQTWKTQIDENEINYKIKKEAKSLPKEYLLSFENTNNQVKISDKNFAYQEFSNKNELNFILDSEAEKNFVYQLENDIKGIPNIRVWSKNPLPEGVSFQYLNSDYEIANSYPDFIIKNNDHYIYLEIKTYKNDNDEPKTKKLYENYKKYIATNFARDIKLTMIICFVNISHKGREKELYFAGASTIASLNKILSDINPDQENHLHDQIKNNSSLNLKDLLNYTG